MGVSNPIIRTYTSVRQVSKESNDAQTEKQQSKLYPY